MSKQIFPYDGWVLMPSFKPVQVALVESNHSPLWHKTESGKLYCTDNIHQSKQAAIAAGRAALDGQQAALEKKQANINKRRAALEKAEAA